MQRIIEKIMESLRAELLNLTFRKSDRCKGFNDGIHTALKIVQEEAKTGGWIPFTEREMDEEEKENFGVEEGYILNCPVPEDGQEILVTYSNGCVGEDTFLKDGNECYLDSGQELVIEALAWQPKPEAYKPEEER